MPSAHPICDVAASWRALVCVVLAAMVAPACDLARLPPGVRFACATQAPHCVDGFECVNGVCVELDAGVTDAGATDAGVLDSGMSAPRLNVTFLTRELFTGNLGGLGGADRRCQNDAEDAGLATNAYRAWLQPGGFAALPTVAGGLVRPDGQAVAPNGEQFESHFLWNVPVLDATGRRATGGRFDFWYGAVTDAGTCNGWSSEDADGGLYRRADYDSPGAHRTWISGCSEARRLLCVGTSETDAAKQPPPPDGGTLIWLGAAVNGKLGYTKPCGTMADGGMLHPFVTANVPAVYWTQLATTGPTYLNVGPIYRPDGVIVAESAHALGANNIQNPITPGQQEVRRNWPHWVLGGAIVWTGAVNPESAAPTQSQPCRTLTDGAWTSDLPAQYAAVGAWDRIGAPLDGWFYVATATDSCDSVHRVYCVRVNGR